VSFATVWINDMAVSWGHGGVQKVILESLEEIIYGRLRTTRSYSNDQLKVTVRRVQDKRLLQPTFLFFAADDEPAWTLTADEAEIRADAPQERVVLTLVNAEIDFGGKGAVSHPGKSEFPVSLSEFSGQKAGTKSPSNYALREIGPQKYEQAQAIAELEREMAAEASYSLMSGRSFELAEDNWSAKRQQLAHAEIQLQRFYTEPHRRWANGFSCLCFALVGAPMAIRLRNADALTSFFLCFLPILLIYYPLMLWGVDRSKAGAVSPYAVWVDNAILAAWGLWMLRKVIRY
jgi:lipopolysaccharide export system permease protein